MRLFVTIVRFDAVYIVHFKCCHATIAGGRFPRLHAWLRDVYQLTAGSAACVAAGSGLAYNAPNHPRCFSAGCCCRSVDLQHIRDHYYGSHRTLNPYGIVPLAFPDDWTAPHGRDTAVFPLTLTTTI